MMLAAAMGTSISVEASGPEANAAMAALEALVLSKFDED
jgi:phosphocarrier protein